MINDGSSAWKVCTVTNKEETDEDISNVNTSINNINNKITVINSNIDDLYKYANQDVVQRDLLAGTDLTKTTNVEDLGAGGAIRLKYPYTDYDYLEWVTVDGDRWLQLITTNKEFLNRIFEICKTTKTANWITTVYIASQFGYITVNSANTATTTYFPVVYTKDLTLISIYGVKLKKGKTN